MGEGFARLVINEKQDLKMINPIAELGKSRDKWRTRLVSLLKTSNKTREPGENPG